MAEINPASARGRRVTISLFYIICCVRTRARPTRPRPCARTPPRDFHRVRETVFRRSRSRSRSRHCCYAKNACADRTVAQHARADRVAAAAACDVYAHGIRIGRPAREIRARRGPPEHPVTVAFVSAALCVCRKTFGRTARISTPFLFLRVSRVRVIEAAQDKCGRTDGRLHFFIVTKKKKYDFYTKNVNISGGMKNVWIMTSGRTPTPDVFRLVRRLLSR